jgi:hypothetical protein
MTEAHAVLDELQLTRTPGDRRLYALKGVGTLRLTGWTSRAGTAEAGALSWQIQCRGFWPRVIQAADAAGVVVGQYKGRSLRRGGALRWCERELALRPDSIWRERYALLESERELATIEGKSWGKRPVNITVDAAAIDPGLLLFAAFVVRTLAHDADASTSGAGAAVIVSS